jgi:hypothetical protein
MKQGEGIIGQIESADHHKIYKEPITKESILKALQDIQAVPRKRSMVMYTGLKGYHVFDFTVKFGESFFDRWWMEYGKHLKAGDLFLSVVRKHSLYKVKVIRDNESEYPYQFILQKGTKMISMFTIERASSYS